MRIRVFIFQLMFMSFFLNACFEVNNSNEKKSSKPVIDHFTAVPSSVMVGDSSVITVDARDLNDEQLSYVWSKPDGGEWLGSVTGETVKWKAPSTIGILTTKNFMIIVKVQNEHSKYILDTVTIIVNQSNNPVVTFNSPQNGIFIPMSTGTVLISASSSYNADSMLCYINGVLWGKKMNASRIDTSWIVAEETEGTKNIQITAFRHIDNTVYSGTNSISVTIEGTIGKPGMKK